MWKAYYQPASLEMALALVNEHRDEARVIAGGTDLLVELRRGLHGSPALVDVTRVPGLDAIWCDGEGTIHLGPTVTHNQVIASSLLRERAFPLVQACWQVGTPALRNRATVAGNVVTASPANDAIPALLAMDARLTLSSVHGERSLPLAEFYRGVRQTVLQPGEVVTDISFRSLQGNERGAFVKLGLRRTHAIALANAAVVISMEGEHVAGARIALGSVAPTVIRVRDAEDALVGTTLGDRAIEEAAERSAQRAVPISDLRGSASYRKRMVRVLVHRVLLSIRDGSMAQAIPIHAPMLWGRTEGRYPSLDRESPDSPRDGDLPIACTVNGAPALVRGAGHKTLLSMLREELGLTGGKEGCGEGECGACTVWMDGIAVLACLVPAPRAHGTRIVTVEGLADGERLHPVQQAFIDEGAVQCGYCTPGFVMASANLLQEIPHPTRDQIAAAISGNLCRCTGYYKIVRAVEQAASEQAAPERSEWRTP
jgi:xanthine dehydrogenase iron-sulfur cluster and FAD-binding subunit A